MDSNSTLKKRHVVPVIVDDDENKIIEESQPEEIAYFKDIKKPRLYKKREAMVEEVTEPEYIEPHPVFTKTSDVDVKQKKPVNPITEGILHNFRLHWSLTGGCPKEAVGTDRFYENAMKYLQKSTKSVWTLCCFHHGVTFIRKEDPLYTAIHEFYRKFMDHYYRVKSPNPVASSTWNDCCKEFGVKYVTKSDPLYIKVLELYKEKMEQLYD